MLYRDIIAVCSEMHTKYVNTLYGQNIEFLDVKPDGKYSDRQVLLIWILIYLLTAIGLTPSGSSIVHIYTQTTHRTTQLTTVVGKLSGIRTQSGQTKITMN